MKPKIRLCFQIYQSIKKRYKAVNPTWSSGSIAVADISNVVWLINCDPKFHFVT